MFYRWIPKIGSVVVFFCILACCLNFGSQAVKDLGQFFSDIQMIPAMLRGTIRSGLVLAMWIFLTFFVGRIYCSIFCPMGLLQQICARYGRRIVPRDHNYQKPYRWLQVSVLFSFVAVGVGIFCLKGKEALFGALKWVDPFSFFERLVSSTSSYIASIGPSSAEQATEAVSGGTLLCYYGILLVILLVAFFFGRFTCNYLCPIGLISGFISRFSFFQIHVKGKSCVNCRRCARRCTSGCIKIKDHTVDTDRCVLCGACLKDCPKSCISFTALRSEGSSAGAGDDD